MPLLRSRPWRILVWALGTTAHLARVGQSSQWRDGKFRNRRPRVDGPFVEMMSEFFFGGSDHRTPSEPVRTVSRNGNEYHVPPASGLPVTWLGHSTSLLEIDGRRLLIDPFIAGLRRRHWGRFDLALHGWTEPIERVLVAAKAEGVLVATPRPGEWIEPSLVTGPTPWWPAVPWRTSAEAPALSTGVEHLMAPVRPP